MRFTVATFKDPRIVLSCLSNLSNSLSGNSLSLLPASIKDVPCSASFKISISSFLSFSSSLSFLFYLQSFFSDHLSKLDLVFHIICFLRVFKATF